MGLALLTRSLWTAVGVHAGFHLATFAAVPFGLGDGPALWLLTGIGHALVGAAALTLWARRGTCALFDSDAFRQHLEAVYQTMYQEHGQRFSSRPR